MTLSNKTKGATTVQRLHSSLIKVDDSPYTVKLYQIIEEIAASTNLTQTDAISAISVMTDFVKEHLGKGHNINLGDLGTFSIEQTESKTNNNKQKAKICYCPSDNIQREINEKVRFKSSNQICQQ